jgi:GNAT superfamily N-acetyltransferase
MKANWHFRNAIPADAASIANVQVNSYQTSYKGLLPDDYLANFTLQEQENDWMRWHNNYPNDILLVALDEQDQIIGYALNRKLETNQTTGEILALHVLPPLKNRGIGRQLLAYSVFELKKTGCNSIFLWTLMDNPSRGFYEHLNGQCVEEKVWIIEELNFKTKEVCYRWDDLDTLLTSMSYQDAN